MPRRLVWIDGTRFRGFGCSECAWVFNTSGSPTGNSFDEMMRNFELQRDKEFTSHVCADHPKEYQRQIAPIYQTINSDKFSRSQPFEQHRLFLNWSKRDS
jgi:hypothetical protein